MKDFVAAGSVVRKIWGDTDMVLFIFAGSAAEFALNRAVDWLFFTGKLPGDPVARLFSTAAYSQQIVFADDTTAVRTLNNIRAIHSAVERKRGEPIPDWAHRDVLYMLIDYSQRAHELLQRPLTTTECADLYDVFYRIGCGLGIPELPASYERWREDRDRHMQRDLQRGAGTDALYAQYRKHLGWWRYQLLLKVQSVLAPKLVRKMLGLRSAPWMLPLVRLYPLLVRVGMRPVIQRLLMPKQYLSAIHNLDSSNRDATRPLHGQYRTSPSPAA